MEVVRQLSEADHDSGINVAPDGENALTTTRMRHTNAIGKTSLETVVVWINASGEETARTVIIDDLPLQASMRFLEGALL